MWQRNFTTPWQFYLQLTAYLYPHCCCHSGTRSHSAWLFCVSVLSELKGIRLTSEQSKLQTSCQKQGVGTKHKQMKYQPVTSSSADDQSTAASSWASSSGDTKSSTRTNPCGSGTDASSSHGTAHTNNVKIEFTHLKWGFYIYSRITLTNSTYLSWQNSGTAWRCSPHTLSSLHWAGCELSEHYLQNWKINAESSWTTYPQMGSIL